MKLAQILISISTLYFLISFSLFCFKIFYLLPIAAPLLFLIMAFLFFIIAILLIIIFYKK